MKKVVFGITSLDCGGAERVLVDLCNKLIDTYDITIFTFYTDGIFERELDSKIKRVSIYNTSRNKLSDDEKKRLSLRLITHNGRKKIYDEYIRDKYDVEISFLEGPMTWVLGTKSNTYKIAWVHSDINKLYDNGIKDSFKNILNSNAYNNYNKIILVSNNSLNNFNKKFPHNKVSKEVIYNYADKDRIIHSSKLNYLIKKDLPTFCVVARLNKIKALDRLIQVHTKLLKEYKHRIYVVGNGPEYEKLSLLIKQNNIADTFILLGEKDNPYPYIRECDYFMLPSYSEGYGMVLIEAEILSKPVLITDTGAKEAVKDYTDKIIVPNNADGIYNGMIKMMSMKHSNGVYNNNNIIKEVIKVIGE
jgi:hypothetical protein